MPVLIDTSSWIESLRKSGKASVRKRVEGLLDSGEVCICDLVLLELWNGASGKWEKKVIKEFTAILPRYDTNHKVWKTSFEIAQKCRQKGVTVPSTDILIFALAHEHKLEIEAVDNDFEVLSKVVG
jgi:predicted nucleic acid-binding protein